MGAAEKVLLAAPYFQGLAPLLHFPSVNNLFAMGSYISNSFLRGKISKGFQLKEDIAWLSFKNESLLEEDIHCYVGLLL